VVGLLDIKTGLLLNYLDDHTAKVNDIAFSPDGTQFATVGKDKQLLVWEVAARPLYRTSEALRGAVYMANSIAGLRDAVPQTWVAKSEESARYSVTIEQKSSSIIQGCSYSEGHTLQRVLSKVDITVTEIAKKRIVARTTLSGEPPIVCPDVYSFSKPIEQTVGPNPDVTAVISWLRRTLPALAAKK
jgi:WD40 repeat protein